VADEGDYSRVRIFYATDRAAEDSLPIKGLSAHGWFVLTCLSASITILAALISYFPTQSRTLLAFSAAGLVATTLLGIMTAYSRAKPDAEALARRFYGNARGNIELGVCDVSIPKRHEVGKLEGPSLLHFELSANPLKHVVVLGVQQQTVDEFYTEMKQRVTQSGRREAFVFVHGYNVTFDDAARRTAQIAYDLSFDGAPILYSWPSQGGLFGYTVDENNVVWTVPHLKEFLVNLHKRSGAEAIHLIAHSMGNRALTSALKEMFFELDRRCPKFNEVVLTAPDVDADVFRRDLAPAIIKTSRRVTLYASSNDEALVLSKKVHGYSRAGESGQNLVIVPGMDTIDVSTIDTSLIGHSYYGDNRTVLTDLFYLLVQQAPPERRQWLQPMRLGSLLYWVFAADDARNDAANSGGATLR